MFFKIDVLKNFANFPEKSQCWTPFNRFTDLLGKVAKFAIFKTFFVEHLRWLLLK